MKRREFIGLIGGAAAWPLAVRAQQPKKLQRLGYLSLGSATLSTSQSFFRGLRDLGYVDGSNILIDARFANGRAELLPAMAADMVKLKPDVLTGATAVGTLALQKETSTIPIVAIAIHDGVRLGLYKSLAHPGGNITGIDTLSEAADKKRVAMLKEIVPQLSRLTMFYNPDDPLVPAHLENTEATLKAMGIAGQRVEVRAPGEFDTAFEAMRQDLPRAIVVFLDPLFTLNRQRIIDFTSEHNIPMIGEEIGWVRLGQLISYGALLDDIWYRAASLADKILKGTDPATFPVEQPTVIKLALNVKTAKTFGLQIPATLLATADEVIE